jgi:hypothetical protein
MSKAQPPSADFVVPAPNGIKSFQGSEPFSLGLGSVAQDAESKVKVQFEAVLEDSRCPPDKFCVWEGQVTISLVVTKPEGNSEKITITKREGATEPNHAEGKVFGHTFKLLKVTREAWDGKDGVVVAGLQFIK